jgi:hypothetical protein
VPAPSDEAYLRAELNVERARRKWAPYKGDPERQCTASCKDGHRCRGQRARRPDGVLSHVCRFHGGARFPSLKSLLGFRKCIEKSLVGLDARILSVLEAQGRACDMKYPPVKQGVFMQLDLFDRQLCLPFSAPAAPQDDSQPAR